MKKIITLLLICTVPFISSAQKSKKSKKTSYEFLVIKGVEINMNNNINIEDGNSKQTGDEIQEQKVNSLINPKSYLTLSFDFGSNPTEENDNLNKEIRLMKTMADAVNISADYGWKFVNSTIHTGEDYIIHYYYMIKE